MEYREQGRNNGEKGYGKDETKMKKMLYAMLAMMLTLSVLPNTLEAAKRPLVSVFHNGVHFAESVYPYDGGFFFSNFGSDKIQPRPDENKGYIIYRKDGVNKTIVPANGTLHKPTGLLVKDEHLFVCDATRLVVFDLRDLAKEPQIVAFAEDDDSLNALAVDGDTLYISVTNPGRIYTLDISYPENMKNTKPKKWIDIVRPNGMAVNDGKLYVVTLPVNHNDKGSEYVVYVMDITDHPKAEVLVNVPGVYDGATFSDDGKTFYFSDWRTASVTALDINTKETRVIYEEEGMGPTDIAQSGGVLYIPDLPNSRIVALLLR